MRVVYNFLGSKSQGKNDRGDSQKSHFKNRFLERTGARCIEPIYQGIVKQAREGTLEFSNYSGTRKVYNFYLHNDQYKVVYDPQTRELVTIFA